MAESGRGGRNVSVAYQNDELSHDLSTQTGHPVMVTFMRGREGTLHASAGRSILRRFSASERPAAGHRAGRCRTSPSQGSRSKGSSRDIKRNMYGFSARISTCGRRADRATSGPLRTVPSLGANLHFPKYFEKYARLAREEKYPEFTVPATGSYYS